MLGKAFPDEVAVEGGGLVLIAYIQPTALLQAWQGRGSRSSPVMGTSQHHTDSTRVICFKGTTLVCVGHLKLVKSRMKDNTAGFL